MNDDQRAAVREQALLRIRDVMHRQNDSPLTGKLYVTEQLYAAPELSHYCNLFVEVSSPIPYREFPWRVFDNLPNVVEVIASLPSSWHFPYCYSPWSIKIQSSSHYEGHFSMSTTSKVWHLPRLRDDLAECLRRHDVTEWKIGYYSNSPRLFFNKDADFMMAKMLL